MARSKKKPVKVHSFTDEAVQFRKALDDLIYKEPSDWPAPEPFRTTVGVLHPGSGVPGRRGR